MVDIETLGNKIDSTIFQIAAIAFDIKTGEYIAEFNRTADIEENEKMNVTGDTLVWWLNTNKELLTNLLNKGQGSSEDLLKDFHNWLINVKGIGEASIKGVGETYLWGNGILFDNAMIRHQFEALGLDYPIFFRNDRDVRTLVDLAASKFGLTEDDLKEYYSDDSLVWHDALDDVKYQIKLVSACHNDLTNF